MRGLGQQVMPPFSKGIDCTGGSVVVEAQAAGALTLSCHVLIKLGCAASVLAKQKKKETQ